MDYKFPFTELDLEKTLEEATESHRKSFLSYLASEPQPVEEPKESEEKGRESISRP